MEWRPVPLTTGRLAEAMFAEEVAFHYETVELRGVAEVALEVRARQPDVQLVEHHAVRQPDRAEQLRLGELEESDISAVKDDACRVYVAPADALLNTILPIFADGLFHSNIPISVVRS